jgi:2-amino-4-hydroxy-6-hydroxymethyldihydropteridine diphosphokinase
MDPVDAFLGLGSNLGTPSLQIARALSELEARSVDVRCCSSLYSTEPLGGPPQPWFVNAVAAVRVEGDPLDLWRVCRGIEALHGRERGVPNGPRTLDLDILLFGEVVLRTGELEIPHPRLAERRFVLVPLVEIAPERRHPVSGLTMRELLARCPDASAVVPLADAALRARSS